MYIMIKKELENNRHCYGGLGLRKWLDYDKVPISKNNFIFFLSSYFKKERNKNHNLVHLCLVSTADKSLNDIIICIIQIALISLKI